MKNVARCLIGIASAALLNCEAVADQEGWTFKIGIGKGVPSIRSFPKTATAKVGWRYPCTVDVENKDAAPRKLSLRVDGRDVLTAQRDLLVLSPGQHATSKFLLQTLFDIEGWNERVPVTKITALEVIREDGIAFLCQGCGRDGGGLKLRGGLWRIGSRGSRQRGKEEKRQNHGCRIMKDGGAGIQG